MSSQKYQGLIDQVNRQKIAIDNEKVWRARYHRVINICNVGSCQGTRVYVEKENS